MNNLNSILDYLKVFNNINKRKAYEPRITAQEPRIGLKPGGIVEPGVVNYGKKGQIQSKSQEKLERLIEIITESNNSYKKTLTSKEALIKAGWKDGWQSIGTKQAIRPAISKELNKLTTTLQKMDNYVNNVMLAENALVKDFRAPQQHLAKKFGVSKGFMDQTWVKESKVYRENKRLFDNLASPLSFNKYKLLPEGTPRLMSDLSEIVANKIPVSGHGMFSQTPEIRTILDSAKRNYLQMKAAGKEPKVRFITDPAITPINEWQFIDNETGRLFSMDPSIDTVEFRGQTYKNNYLNHVDARKLYKKEFGNIYKMYDEDLVKYMDTMVMGQDGKPIKLDTALRRQVFDATGKQSYLERRMMELDHADLWGDPFGRKKDGLRLLDRRVNQQAGLYKQIYKNNPKLLKSKLDEIGYNKKFNNTDELIKFYSDRAAGKQIIEKSPEWMKWSSRKQAELFRAAGVSAKDFKALNNMKSNEKITMLKKMGFKCRLQGGAGESVDCYMKDVGETNKLAKQGNKQAIKKLGNAFDLGKELPKIGKILRQGLQIGLAGPAKLLEFSGLGTWGGLLLEGALEGGIYKYYKDYKGYTDDQALAETFTVGLLAGRPEDVPWYGGAEQKLEKELYEVKDEAGDVVDIKENVKDFIDTQKKMEEVESEYDKLESKKRDVNEMRGYASPYMDTDYAHPRLDPRVSIENKQKALENKYLKLEQLNKPDALTGNYNAWLAAKEKQDTEQGLRVAEATKKRLGAVDIPWDVLNPNEMQPDYKLKKYERAQDRWEKEQAEKRYRQMREKFPGYSDKQIDEILEYYETTQPQTQMSYDQLRNMFDIGQKQAYFAENFRMEKAGGGLANLTTTVAPDSGPMSQGLRSLYIDDMDY